VAEFFRCALHCATAVRDLLKNIDICRWLRIAENSSRSHVPALETVTSIIKTSVQKLSDQSRQALIHLLDCCSDCVDTIQVVFSMSVIDYFYSEKFQM
jgi:hypothetical protein